MDILVINQRTQKITIVMIKKKETVLEALRKCKIIEKEEEEQLITNGNNT